MWRQWLPLAGFALMTSACNPYYRDTGESSAGAVDPALFPAAYLGVGVSGDPTAPASANMTGAAHMLAATAHANGKLTGYFTFPFTGADFNIALPTDANTAMEYAAPDAYSFDEDQNTLQEVPKCQAPRNYVYDQQRDDVRYDTQGNIFTDLPEDPTYQPIVAEVTVTSSGPSGTLPCQATKEDINLVKRKDVSFVDGLTPPMFANEPGAHPIGTPTKRFLARPIIDPSIDVRDPAGYTGPTDMGGEVDPNTGLGPQRWGWYGRYLLAWLDGGVIPTKQSTVMDAQGNSQTISTMITQAIYFPTTHPVTASDGSVSLGAGQLGDGFDVFIGRGEAGFSPLCQVFSFDPKDPMNPEQSVADIDVSTMMDQMTYIWCIQVTQ